MNRANLLYGLIGIFLFSGCNKINSKEQHNDSLMVDSSITLCVDTTEPNKNYRAQIDSTVTQIADEVTISDTTFISVLPYKDEFVFDMKYATTNNFLKEKVYDCGDCLLRKVVVDALLQAGKALKEKGYKIKFFDCYRPLDVQKKMWEIFPDSRYVANPKNGSIHNRGGAVDITLVNDEGKELDMGTGFDHFGVEAHHSYTQLDFTVLANRKVLKEIMEANGFTAQPTEWWHYNYKAAKNFPVANTPLNCNE